MLTQGGLDYNWFYSLKILAHFRSKVLVDFRHYNTRIKCLTGAIISETHTRHKYIYYLNTILHMGLRLHEDAGWIEGAAARGGLSRSDWTRTCVRLQPVHWHDLLPLAHLDGEGLRPLGDHQVGAGIWGRQRLLLAANPHVHVLSEPAESWPPPHRTAALLEASARLHVEDLARAGTVQGEPVVFQWPAPLKILQNPP